MNYLFSRFLIIFLFKETSSSSLSNYEKLSLIYGECSNTNKLNPPIASSSNYESSIDECTSLINSYCSGSSSIDTEEYNFYVNNFDLEALSTFEDTNKKQKESFKKENQRFKKIYNNYIGRIIYFPLSNNFIDNILVIRKHLSLNGIISKDEFDEDDRTYYNTLVHNMQVIYGTNKRICLDETNLIKSTNEKILKNYPLVRKSVVLIKLDYKQTHGSSERTLFTKNLNYIISLIKKSIIVSVSDEIIMNINYRKYICLEVNKFIDRYKYLPEVLNMKMFLFTKNSLPETLFMMYVLIRMMNISLNQNNDENIHNTVSVFYHSALFIYNYEKMNTRNYLSHEYVSDSIIGSKLLSIDLLNTKQKRRFFHRIRNARLIKIDNIMLRNKTFTFNLFLIVNLHLFVKCIEEETRGEFGNINLGDSIILDQFKVLENLFKEFMCDYNKYSEESILNCLIVIYNYLMYGNNYE